MISLNAMERKLANKFLNYLKKENLIDIANLLKETKENNKIKLLARIYDNPSLFSHFKLFLNIKERGHRYEVHNSYAQERYKYSM